MPKLTILEAAHFHVDNSEQYLFLQTTSFKEVVAR